MVLSPQNSFGGALQAGTKMELWSERKIMRHWLVGALSLSMFFGAARAAGPEFEVASIKAAAQLTPDSFRSGKVHLGTTMDGRESTLEARH
jgi:hypothetical protein